MTLPGAQDCLLGPVSLLSAQEPWLQPCLTPGSRPSAEWPRIQRAQSQAGKLVRLHGRIPLLRALHGHCSSHTFIAVRSTIDTATSAEARQALYLGATGCDGRVGSAHWACKSKPLYIAINA